MSSADLQRVIRIVFQGDDRDAADAINRTIRGLDSFEGALGNVTGPLADVADNVMAVDAALLALATGTLALMINEAGKFGDGFAEVSTLVDATGDDLSRFQTDLLNYSATSSSAFDQVNGAVYAAISAGIDYRDSLGFVADAERLAIAGKGDLQATTVALASTLNAYGEEADQAARYSDILFQTVRSGQTTLPELAQSLSQVTSIAASAGIPFETVAAAIADLTAKGMPTAEAMTSIKGAIQAIIKPTEDAKKAAEDLGLDFSYAALQSRGFEGVLLDVYTATGGNVEQIARLFSNVEGLKGELALFGQDGGAGFLATLEEMRNSSGATAEAYERMAANFELTNQRLANQVRATLITAGMPLLDEYRELADSLGAIFGGVRFSLDAGAFDDVLDYLQARGLDLSRYLRSIAEALPAALEQIDWSKFLAALGNLGDSLGAFFGDLDLRDADDLARVLQGVADAVAGVINITAGMADSFRPFVQEVSAFLLAMSEGDQEAMEAVGRILGYAKLIEEFGLKFLLLLEALHQFQVDWSDVIDFTAGSVQILWNTLQTFIDGIRLLLAEVRLIASEAANAATLGLSSSFREQVTAAEADVAHLRQRIIEHGEDSARGWDRVVRSFNDTSTEAQAAARETAALGAEVGKLPAETEVGITLREIEQTQQLLMSLGFDLAAIPHEKVVELAAIKDQDSFETAFMALGEIPGSITTTVSAVADQEALENAAAVMGMTIPPRRDIIIETRVDPETGEQVIEFFRNPDNIPAQKEVTVTADTTAAVTDLDRIKVAADLVKHAVEWRAKLEIAEVEANARRVEAIMDSVGQSASGAADALGAIFGNVGDLRSAGIWTSQIEQYIEREMSIQEEAIKIQRDVADAEIRMMESRRQRLDAGGALITVTGDGPAPHLEAMLFSVLEAVQVRANASEQDFLLGLP